MKTLLLAFALASTLAIPQMVRANTLTDLCGSKAQAVMQIRENNYSFGFSSKVSNSKVLAGTVLLFPNDMEVSSQNGVVSVSLWDSNNQPQSVRLGTIVTNPEHGIYCLALSNEVQIKEISESFKEDCFPFPKWTCGRGVSYRYRIIMSANEDIYRTSELGIREE